MSDASESQKLEEDIPKKYLQPLLELRKDKMARGVLRTLYSFLKEDWKPEVEQKFVTRKLGLKNGSGKYLLFFETVKKLKAKGLMHSGEQSNPWYSLTEEGIEIARLDMLLDKLMYSPLADYILNQNPELKDKIDKKTLENEVSIYILSELQNQ